MLNRPHTVTEALTNLNTELNLPNNSGILLQNRGDEVILFGLFDGSSIPVQNYKNTYADNTAYVADDVVLHGDNFYRVTSAVAADNTTSPDSNSAFEVVNTGYSDDACFELLSKAFTIVNIRNEMLLLGKCDTAGASSLLVAGPA